MIYLGPQTNVDYNQSSYQHNGHEVIVMQQHCGGQNIILYKNNLRPNGLSFLFKKNMKMCFVLFLFKKNLHLNLDVIMTIHLH